MVSPVLFVGIRMLLAGCILIPLSLYRYRFNWAYLKEDKAIILGIALFTTFLPSIFKAFALANMPAPDVALIGSLDPFITAFYAYILWGDTLTMPKILGMMLGCLGMTFLAYPKLLSVILAVVGITTGAVGDVACAPLAGPLAGSLLPYVAIVASIILSRFGWSLVRLLLKRERYTPPQLNSLIMTISGFIALIAAPLVGSVSVSISSPGYFNGLFAFTVIVGNVIGYSLYGYVLKHNNITLVSLCGVVTIPLLVSLYSWLFFGTHLTIEFAAVAFVFFMGIFLFYFDEIRTQKLFKTK